MKTKKENGKQNANGKEIFQAEKPNSAYTLFRERHPNGIGDIVNMRAVLR
jgi:hypothetical protein